MKIIFATHNKHKLIEIRAILGKSFDLLSLDELGFHEELKEDFDTLEENAIQKAKFISEQFDLPCFADDSGLEINALDGRPGVLSARYAGEEKSAAANMKKVLEEMKDVINRSAVFKTVIAFVVPEKVALFSGEVQGQILSEISGEKGFGYDPIFMPDGFRSSFAMMNPEQKNSISHRAIAVNKLAEFLKKAYPEFP